MSSYIHETGNLEIAIVYPKWLLDVPEPYTKVTVLDAIINKFIQESVNCITLGFSIENNKSSPQGKI